MGKMMEAVFCAAYLICTLVLGIKIVKLAKENNDRNYNLYGIMTLVLVGGDSFHLVPRIMAAIDRAGDYSKAMGIGTLITSITMTIFYLLMYIFYEKEFLINGQSNLSKSQVLMPVMKILTATRIVLCLMPQNDWKGDSPVIWGIYRNIPFVVMGIIMIVLFYMASKRDLNAKKQTFKYMWLAILLSFAFYLPVVLWADVNPMVGMFMMPKTCMYVWMVVMGYKAQRQ